MRKFVVFFLVGGIVGAGFLLWKHNPPQKPVVKEDPVQVKEERIEFDLNPEERKLLFDSGIAQTVIFLHKDYFVGEYRKQFEVPDDQYEFMIEIRRSKYFRVFLGVKLPGVDPGYTLMELNDFLKLPDRQAMVIRKIIDKREKK